MMNMRVKKDQTQPLSPATEAIENKSIGRIHGLIPHQTGYYYISLEEDYVTLFQRAAWKLFEASAKTDADEKKRATRLAHAVAKAYISSVLEHLSDSLYKTTESDEDLWVFLSFPELEARLHGAYKMRTLKEAMKELVEDGYVLKRSNRDPHFKALEYRMNLEQYRVELAALPQKTKKNRANMHAPQKDHANRPDERAISPVDHADMHDASCEIASCDEANSHTRRNSLDNTKRQYKDNIEKKAAPSHEQTVMQSETVTVAALLSLLQHVTQEQVHHVLEQRLYPTITEDMSPSTISSKQAVMAVEDGTSEEKPLQKPASDALRNSETVVALVEFLRGQRYTPNRRPRECHAARKLLSLQPAFSLSEIEAAWLHGSDDYWRHTHNEENVHVHDLVNQNSHGMYHVEAFLKHKRAQEWQMSQQFPHHQRDMPPVPPAQQDQRQPAMKRAILSEEQAKSLVEQIRQDAAVHGYRDLHGDMLQEGAAWMVRVSWLAPLAWKGDLGLEMYSAIQWQREFAEWQEILRIRETRNTRKGA